METALPVLAECWLPAERAALRPTERLRPSDWAEKHRVLTRMQSARPGPWRNDHAPYLAGLMDLCANRGVEELTIVKAAQIGVSEALRNVVRVVPEEQPGRTPTVSTTCVRWITIGQCPRRLRNLTMLRS